MRRRIAVTSAIAAAAACGGKAPLDAEQSHARMLAALRAVAAQARVDNIYFGRREPERLLQQFAAAGERAEWRLRLDAAMAELQAGNERRGIAILTELREGLQKGAIRGDYVAAMSASFYLGVGWMRLAETNNCCKAPVPESCILPFAVPAQHRDREGATNAVHYFVEVLQNSPPDDYWHLSAQWLLNLANMTLGSWPDGVPAEWRIPRMVEAGGECKRFVNVAGELGLDTMSNAGGVVVDDLDGDDRLDIVVTDWRPDAQMRFFHNRGDGTFEDRTEAAGLVGITGGLNLRQADYDNDGDLDLLVLRGAWWYETGKHPNSLLQNDGKGHFRDVAFLCGIAGDENFPTQAAAWADYDNDGDLDLYVGNENSTRAPSPSQLFRNNGDGTFTDVARAAGVTDDRYAKAVAWGDIDGDGDPDLYVSNQDGDNRLYENRGDGTFVDVAPTRRVVDPQHGFPCWFFDCDNDGALDLFAANYDTGVGHVAAHLLGKDLGQGRPRLYHGDGKGMFTEVGVAAGLTYPSNPMGANFGDYDGDGYPDIYLGTGDPNYQSLVPNLLYHNVGGARFADVTVPSGTGHLQKGHGIAFADLDGDGDLDIFAEMGGAWPGDAFRNALFENPGFGNHWLTLLVVGTTSNRCAIGTRIRVVVRAGGAERSIFREVGSGGSFGASPLRQTIGLGRAEAIVRVELFWPRTRKTQVVTGMALDAAARIVEGEAEAQALRLEPAPFRR
ncbi:MAG: CRTAC1 family protein [Planctomycetota bacterium]